MLRGQQADLTFQYRCLSDVQRKSLNCLCLGKQEQRSCHAESERSQMWCCTLILTLVSKRVWLQWSDLPLRPFAKNRLEWGASRTKSLVKVPSLKLEKTPCRAVEQTVLEPPPAALPGCAPPKLSPYSWLFPLEVPITAAGCCLSAVCFCFPDQHLIKQHPEGWKANVLIAPPCVSSQ